MQDILLEQLKQQVQKVVFYLEVKESFELLKEVKFQLQKAKELIKSQEEIDEYSKMAVRLEMLRFASLRDDEVKRLIKESTLEMLSDPDLVLEERIEGRQLAVEDFMRFETVNQPIMEALHENIEIIGDEKIIVTGANSTEIPTVKNWLLDYDRINGTQPQKDLTWLEYAKKNAISAHLNAAQADLLRKVLKLYEWLKREHDIDQE
jgi:hypothetical protein